MGGCLSAAVASSGDGRRRREAHNHQEGPEPMGITLPAFTPLEDSLWLTLCCRALDNRSPHPILGDAMADEIVRKLDYDYGQLHINTNLIVNVAPRAKKLDEVASGFLARHPDAVGLDLGAGLDTRMIRLAPPPTVDWYDIDFPFPSGEMVFNSYTKFAIWAAKHSRGTQSVAGLVKFPGFDDPREPESWNPKLKLVKEILLSREPEVSQLPSALRLYYQLQAHSTAWSRKGTIVLHYRF
jgi:Leucine carboxyl methyltransferase